MAPRRKTGSTYRGLVAGLGASLMVLTSIGTAAGAATPADRSSVRTAPEGSTETAGDPFSLVFQDDFNGTAINRSSWGVFNGAGNGITGPKSKTNAFVRDGNLVLRARKINGVWYGAGVSNARAVVQTFGKYEMRVRFGPGKGVRTAALLWPKDGGWPPEVNFYEFSAGDAQRTTNVLANHYGSNNEMEHARIKGDYTRWHVVGVEWRPRSLRFTLDGAVVATMTQHVPQQPMWFGQNVALGGKNHPVDATTPAYVDAEIDWITIYRYNR